jgi:hypothetical protein
MTTLDRSLIDAMTLQGDSSAAALLVLLRGERAGAAKDSTPWSAALRDFEPAQVSSGVISGGDDRDGATAHVRFAPKDGVIGLPACR